jgi:hypothetical protein
MFASLFFMSVAWCASFLSFPPYPFLSLTPTSLFYCLQVRAEMAAETGRMQDAMRAQHAELSALMERASRFEEQSRSAQAELDRVRRAMHVRHIQAEELDLLTVPAVRDRVDAPPPRRHVPVSQSPVCLLEPMAMLKLMPSIVSRPKV